MPPADLVAALAAPVGEHQLVAMPISGAIVLVTISPRGEDDPDRDAELWRWLYGYVILRMADHADIGGNVASFPLRQELPGEFAAIAIDELLGQQRILAVNTRQSHAAAMAALRKLRAGIVVPVLAGAAAERIVHVARNHRLASAIAATAAAASAFLGGLSLVSGGEVPRSPSDAIQVITSPPVTITATSTVSATPTPVPPRGKATSETAAPSRQPSPATTPSAGEAAAERSPEVTGAPTAPPVSRPTPRQHPTPSPVQSPEVTSTPAGGCDAAVPVGPNPVAEVCLPS